jgi:hypothetical protein
MNVPKCKNPQHPLGAPMEMRFLEEQGGVNVYACQACKDINKKLSVQMVSSAALKKMTRDNLRQQGRLMTEKPKPIAPQMRGGPQKQPLIEWDAQRRRSKDGRYELVMFRDLGHGDIQVQMAVDGKLAPMMDDHIASREQYKTDQQYFSRLAQSSELMIHLYGDARTPLSEDEVQQRQHMTY